MKTLLFVFFLYGAQNSPTSGSLTGTVWDTSNAVVPGAVISARSLSTNQTRQTSSMEDGSYRFPALPPDSYEIRVNLPGFEPYLNPNVRPRSASATARSPNRRRGTNSGWPVGPT